MNILVIGGCGLFGRKTVVHLLGDPEIARVVSMDVNEPQNWFNNRVLSYNHRYQFVRGDVSELDTILGAIRKFSIDRIINLAFILTGAFESNPRLAIKVNALGMCNSFEAARLMDISRVVYASSVGVYGPQNEYGDREVNEDDRPHPGNAYGVTKQLAELVAQQYRELYGIQFSALRPFLGYGHGGAFPPIIKQYSDLISLPAVGKTFSTEMDGNGLSALSSADDVAELIKILIKAPSSRHPAYNVATRPTSMRDVAQAVQKYIPEARISFGHQSPPQEVSRMALPWKVSCERAREDFGFSVMPLEESVLLHINDARLEAGLDPLV